MRVLLVSHHAPPHLGGVEQVVHTEARALLAVGHEVIWLTSDGGGGGEPVAATDGLEVRRLPAWHWIERRFGIAYPLFSPRLAAAAWRATGEADAVHVHGLVFQNSVAAALCARLRGKPCVVTDHGGLLRFRSRLATAALRAAIETAGRLTARCATRLCAINADLERLLRRLGRADRVAFVPNPVDRSRFRPPSAAERAAARRRLGWDDTPRVLSVGRLLPHKGADLLLAERGDYRIVLCGPGEPAAIANAHAAGAEVLPPRPQAELLELYHAADAFALPSHNEGFPLVVQEALACGLPVVTTDAPAYAPYRGLPGLHLCARDAAAVHSAIRAVLAGPRPDTAALAASPLAAGRDEWLRAVFGEVLP